MRAALRLHAMRGVPEKVDKLDDRTIFETYAALSADVDFVDSFRSFASIVVPPASSPKPTPPPDNGGVKPVNVPDREPHITNDGFNADEVVFATEEHKEKSNEAALQALEILQAGLGDKSPIKITRSKTDELQKVEDESK